MSEAKHTAGPWKISGYFNNGCGVSNGVQGVASVYGTGEDEAKANGLLISAAPELLEALRVAEKSLAALAHPNCGATPGDPLHTIRAAIAKAVQP